MELKLEKFSQETQDYGKSIESALLQRHGEVKSEWISLIKLACQHYENFLLASEHIRNYGVMLKTPSTWLINPAVNICKDATSKINNIVQQLALSPKEESKLKLKENDDDDYLNSLTNG